MAYGDSLTEAHDYWDEYQRERRAVAQACDEARAVEERLTRERDEALAALAGCVRYQSMRTYLDKEPYHAAWTEAHRIVGPRPN